MIQTWKRQGWLVVAATLTIGFAACSSDDVATIPQSAAKTVYVTVGAGIDGADTRSAVVQDANTKDRSLTLTTGDKLAVVGYLDDAKTQKLYGSLTMVENSLSDDAKTAKFDGELTLPEGTDLGDKDPLGECKSILVTLVHKDGACTVTEGAVAYNTDWASDAAKLMTTMLTVSSDTYDADNKSFTLKSSGEPIVSAEVSGLVANTEYMVTYCYGKAANNEKTVLLKSPLTADASGKAALTFFASAETDYKLHAIQFTAPADDTDILIAELGEKQLKTAIVYQVSAAARIPGSYLIFDKNGASTENAIPSGAVKLSTANTWSKGTYLAFNNVTINDDVTLSGDVNLILFDGFTLTVNGKISGDYKLNIYGQTDGTGIMTSGTIDVKDIAIYGGKITATGADVTETNAEGNPGVKAATLTVYGGTLTGNGSAGNGGYHGGGIYEDTNIYLGAGYDMREATDPTISAIIPGTTEPYKNGDRMQNILITKF